MTRAFDDAAQCAATARAVGLGFGPQRNIAVVAPTLFALRGAHLTDLHRSGRHTGADLSELIGVGARPSTARCALAANEAGAA